MGKYVTVLKRAISNYGSHNGTSFAAAISYNALFSIFPLALFLLGFLGFFIHSSSQRESIINNIFSALNGGVSKSALTTQVNAVAGGSAAVGILGLVIAAWSASGVFSRVRTSMNVIWDSTKSRPLVPGKLLDLAMVIAVGALILLSVAATGVLTAVQGFSGQIFGSSLGWFTHLLFALLYLVIPPAISFVAFSLVYWLVPHAEVRVKDVWFGALVAAVLFEIVQLGFAFYVANLGHYAKTYGALGGVIAFLFFIYISANILLFGGEIAKEHIDVEAGVKKETEPAQPGPKKSMVQQVEGFVKGLFIDDSPHHDTSLPYEPGRNKPAQPPAALVKDDEAHSNVKQFQQGNAPAGSTASGSNGNGGNGQPATSNRQRASAYSVSASAKFPHGEPAEPRAQEERGNAGHSQGRSGRSGDSAKSGAAAADGQTPADGTREDGASGQRRRWHGDPRRTRDPNPDSKNNHLPLP
jgi:membrane protein